jgi:hypothetical protein
MAEEVHLVSVLQRVSISGMKPPFATRITEMGL